MRALLAALVLGVLLMPLDVGRVTHLIEQMHRSEDDAGDPIDEGKVLVSDGARGFTWEDHGGGSVDGAYTVEPQTPFQARHYLQRDGTWRDPFTVGLGTVTAGSPSTITDDTKYNAWPTVQRMTEQRLILAYTKGDSHHGDNTGKAVVKIGTEDGAGTISWGSEITAYDDPSLWSTVQAISVISTGRVFATLWRDNASVSGTGEAGIVYSDDDGATWTDWMDLTNSFTQESYGAGRVVEMPDGDLLVTIEGSNTGQSIANRSSHTLRSTDGGETWGGEVTIRNYVTDSRPYYETQLVLLDDNSLIAVHRTSGGSPGTHYISTSTDFGMTWGAPVAEFAGYGQPNTIQASTGTLFSLTRENGTGDVIMFTSTDRGITWDSGTVLTTAPFEMEYGCPIESLRTGEVYVVYGDQPTSGTTNADIDILTVTEDVDTFSSGITVEDEGTPLATTATTLDFVGAGVVASGTGAEKTITISGAPAGAAGGDLSGTYPNPSVVDDSHNHTSATAPGGGIGEILISDTPSTPLIFADLIQNEAQDDLVYADP